MPRIRQLRRVLFAGLACALLACAPKESGEAPTGANAAAGPGDAPGERAGYPGTLIPTQDIGRDFTMRQKLQAEVRGKTVRFEAIVQKVDDDLRVVGLTPFGTKAFMLRQVGTEVEFEAFIDRELPFPPEDILHDIHRTFLWDVRLPEAPSETGERRTEVDDEVVVETWSEGRLQERRFERAAQPQGVLKITYEGGMAGAEPPQRVVLDNGWFDYRLTVETVEYTPG